MQIKFVFVKVSNGVSPQIQEEIPLPPVPSLTNLGPWCYRTSEFTDSLPVFCEGKGVPSILSLLVSLLLHGSSLVLGDRKSVV